MNIACPECDTLYRVDPDRVPANGTAARCSECGAAFRVDPSLGPTPPGESATAPLTGAAPSPESTPEPAPEPGAGEPGPGPPEPETPVFGPQDPHTRARRLARALVSDIKAYHPDKWTEATEAGTLRSEFRHEILKSWDEYVAQVGEEMARKTPYFREALNQILADGEKVF